MRDKFESIDIFVPGRLCLFGEHSDWAGLQRMVNAEIEPGHAIVTGTEEGIYATVTKSKQFCVHSSIEENIFSFQCEMDAHKLKKIAGDGEFFSYVAGVASYVCEWYQTGGLDVNITKMTLPMKSGLSSSAAICVLVAKAFNELYNLRLSTKGTMNIAYWGELRTKSRCGRLDQACAFGTVPVYMSFDSNEIDVSRIKIGGYFYYVFADLMASKDTVKILSDLNRSYPFPETEIDYKVHEALGIDNKKIVEEAKHYIEVGNAKGLGKLMTNAQKNFDKKVAPACPEELEAPVLHSVLNDVKIQSYIYGAKGVGSQGDGTVQLLAKDERCQAELIQYLEKERDMRAYKLTLKPQNVVRKAVITVAGYGTRMYPYTRGIRKEFIPIVDGDGLAKPGILVLLQELVQAGIEEICLVLGSEEDREFYEKFFFKPLSQNHFDKLTEQMQEYERMIRTIADKMKFCYQLEQKGFGDAVYQCKDFANGEPVLLMLGDTIYESTSSVSCTTQFLQAFSKYGGNMISLQKIALQDVQNYGVFSGTWEEENSIMNITKVKEKPSKDYALENMGVRTKEGVSMYGTLGLYMLTNTVFSRLEDMINNNITSHGEIQFTDALDYVREQYGLYGFIPQGKSYDLGNVKSYRKAVSNFGRIKNK